MKRFLLTATAVASMFVAASCQKEIKPVDNAKEGIVPFELNASIDNSKTTMSDTWVVDWEDGDVIYAVTTDEEWGKAYVSKDETYIETIAEYTLSAGKFTTEKTISAGQHTFNFLYSRENQKTYHRGQSTAVQIPAIQEIDLGSPRANLKTYDALVGQATVNTPSSNVVNVSMNHLFSIMKVTLTNNTGSDVNVKYFDFKIPGKDMTGNFNVTFAEDRSYVSSTKSKFNEYIRVEVKSNGTIANGESKDVYYVLPPVSGVNGDVEMVVTTSDATPVTFTKTFSVSNLSFTAGKYTKGAFELSKAEEGETDDNKTVTINLTKNETSAASTQNLTWTRKEFSIVADKGNATTNANNYYPGTTGKSYTSTRFYKNSTLKITPAEGVTISKIVYEATTADYANALKSSEWKNASAKVSDKTVTVTPVDGTEEISAVISNTTGGTSITVYYTEESSSETPGGNEGDEEEESFSIVLGTNASTASVNDATDAVKVGTSKAGGEFSIKISSKISKLSFYAAAWKGGDGTIVSIDATKCISNSDSLKLAADDGVSSNSPFTLTNEDLSSFAYQIDLTNVETGAVLTFESDARFVVWGITAE